MQKKESSAADRVISISRLLDAPIDLVWEVWTDPEHIKNWWGPDGFTNTIQLMDMKEGGEWNLIMHGPDGTDYKNKSVFMEVDIQDRDWPPIGAVSIIVKLNHRTMTSGGRTTMTGGPTITSS